VSIVGLVEREKGEAFEVSSQLKEGEEERSLMPRKKWATSPVFIRMESRQSLFFIVMIELKPGKMYVRVHWRLSTRSGTLTLFLQSDRRSKPCFIATCLIVHG
jgi:hypothetical protein